jgi:putative hydrolase of the HAD superfamily
MSPLARQIAAAMRPMEVLPTGLAPKLPHRPGLRAVVFDLYGTLLISAAGGSHAATPELGDLPGIGQLVRETVGRHQDRRRGEGVAFPEVEIREVWAEALAEAGRPVPPPDELEALVLAHECLANPVWPMPGAAETLAALREGGTPLGLVSNAQFYTPPTMEGLFGADLDALGFHPGLRVFSYEEREGKPSATLFRRLGERAAALGIGVGEILYLGNDLDKDVLPARAAGCFAALFAGEARSLRLGGRRPEEASAIADAVVTELGQVPALLRGDGAGG